MTRKYILRKVRKEREIIISSEQKERLIQVCNMYLELGTLQAVADKLHITRERVRQLLEKGQKYKLYDYVLTNEKRFDELILRITRENLLEEILNLSKISRICKKLDINIQEYLRLIKYYGIDTDKTRRDSSKRRYVNLYFDIFDILGRHPSTTEMQQNKKWRSVSAGIERIWGSTEKFRLELGIKRPKFRYNSNSTLNRKKSDRKIIRSKANKINKINQILDLITYQHIDDTKTISEKTDIPRPTVISYLRELLKRGRIIKKGKGINTRYLLP